MVFGVWRQEKNASEISWPLTEQGLLKLLWTVYSVGKLQSCLKLRNFQNPFNKNKSDIPGTNKGLKFALVVELAKLICTYITVHTKIAKAGPGFDDRPEHPSVQINSSSPWIEIAQHRTVYNVFG